MAGETESGPVVDSGTGNGQAPASEQLGVQPTSPAAPFTEDQARFIREEARRAAQSDKDRATSRLEKTVTEQGDQIKRIHDLVKQGRTPEQIEDQLFLDGLKAEYRSGSPRSEAVAPTSATPAGQTAAVDYLGIYTTLGLEAGDSEVIRLTQANPNPDKLWVELGKLKQRRNLAPAPPAGSVTAPAGGGLPDNSSKLAAVNQEVAKMLLDPKTTEAKLRAKLAEQAALTGQLK